MKTQAVLVLVLVVTLCAGNFDYGVKYEARVLKVVDGDTFYAEVNGEKVKIRVLGIDTPEIIAEKNKPMEYGDITNLTCLALWGVKAKEFVKRELEGKVVLIEFDRKAGLKDKYGRLLAYVYYPNEGTDFAAKLIKLGYARVFVEGEFSKKAEYLSYQNSAKKSRVGLWSCS